MDNQKQNLKVTADTAEAENDNNAATELGKFKDVKALMQAYANLEAEFTRRSQRLKELENANKEQPLPAEDAVNQGAPSQGQEVLTSDDLLAAALNSDEVKNAIISAYLENAAKNKGVQFITGGVNIPAEKRVPKTVREAGALAQQFLNKREN
jgi:hypothetical protein